MFWELNKVRPSLYNGHFKKMLLLVVREAFIAPAIRLK